MTHHPQEALPTDAFLLSASQRAVGRLMGAFWSNLAKHGTPNGAGLPQWSAYDSASDLSMQFGAQASAAAMGPNRAAQCQFLEGIGFTGEEAAVRLLGGSLQSFAADR